MNDDNEFYVCPNHQRTQGYESCCPCGGWSENEEKRLCSQNTEDSLEKTLEFEAEMIRISKLDFPVFKKEKKHIIIPIKKNKKYRIDWKNNKLKLVNMKNNNWIAGAIKNKGSLRSSLGIKKGQTIPLATLKKATKAKGKKGRRARLAITLRKLK